VVVFVPSIIGRSLSVALWNEQIGASRHQWCHGALVKGADQGNHVTLSFRRHSSE
jgi:hypothetical protein